MGKYRAELLLCGDAGCLSSGSREVKDALEQELINQNLDKEIRVVETGCNGFCAQGPVMIVQPEEIFYQKLKPEDIPHLVEDPHRSSLPPQAHHTSHFQEYRHDP